ncbi:MAG TPA: ATP-binding protein [Bacteroidota bacterium]|jgi:PAS domain S-box-containing protein|nr:ATP-binding protein [Bacteroidota bacterium]
MILGDKYSAMSLRAKLTFMSVLVLAPLCIAVSILVGSPEFYHLDGADHRLISAIIGIGVFVSCALVVFIVATLVTRPLRKVVQSVERAAKGDLNVQATAPYKDEVEQIAVAINTVIRNSDSTMKKINAVVTLLDKREEQLEDAAEERKFIEKQVQLSNEILEKVSALILVVDSTGGIQYASRSFESILGYPPKDLLQEGWWQSSRPETTDMIDWLRERGRVAKCARRQQLISSLPYEQQVVDVRGKLRWILWQDTEGFNETLIVVGQDITGRKLAEEQIREKAALLDITSDAILVRSLDNHVVYWNRGAEMLYGISQSDAIGKDVHELYEHEDSATVGIASTNVIENGVWNGEMKKTTRGGKGVIVESRWTLMNDEMGIPKSILVVDTDVTEQRQLEVQFRRAQRLENIGTLAGGIAHDLNNVLTPILMSIPILQKRNGDERSRQLLTTIETSAQRGADIVKQVLTFARGTEGERTLLQPKHFLRDIVEISKETFPRSIALKFEVPENLWTITGDATQLHQIVLNLLVNARDAMPEGGSLTLRAENVALDEKSSRSFLGAKAENYVMLSVKDTGIGIPSEILDKIFDPFFTTKEVGKGTGLGLSTVMTIVKSYGGFLTVESTPAIGTEFKVFIPATNAPISEAKSNRRAKLPVGKGEWVLVVDDEISIREITKETLEAYGYRSQTAKDGVEALSVIERDRDKIDLVLTDMMMPNMDGASLIRRLERVAPDIKIVAVSGVTDQLALEKIKKSRIEAFLPKPIHTENLLRILDSVLHAEAEVE